MDKQTGGALSLQEIELCKTECGDEVAKEDHTEKDQHAVALILHDTAASVCRLLQGLQARTTDAAMLLTLLHVPELQCNRMIAGSICAQATRPHVHMGPQQ